MGLFGLVLGLLYLSPKPGSVDGCGWLAAADLLFSQGLLSYFYPAPGGIWGDDAPDWDVCIEESWWFVSSVSADSGQQWGSLAIQGQVVEVSSPAPSRLGILAGTACFKQVLHLKK